MSTIKYRTKSSSIMAMANAVVPSPCLDCPDREVGCHDICEKYKTFIQKRSDVRHEMMEERKVDEYISKQYIKRKSNKLKFEEEV